MFTYLVIFLSVLGISLVCITRHARRYARDVQDHPWLARGLRTTAVGSVVFFGYCLLRGMYLLGLLAGANLSLLIYAAQPCAAFGSLIFVAGLTMPGWGHHASSVHNWLRAYRDHHRLHPLWRALYSAFPEIALDPPSSQARWKEFSPRDIPYRLYRRVIEIQDGCRALRPYLEPHATDTAAPHPRPAGQRGKESAALAEALRITHALRAKERGHSYPQETATEDHLFGRDLEEETARLSAISQALSSLLVKKRPDPLAGRLHTRGTTMNDEQVPTPSRLHASSGAVFFNHQGDVLLVNPTYKPYWNLPGGQVDHGESPRDACIREVREELGIEPEIGPLLTAAWTRRTGHEDRMLFVFDGGELTPEEQSAITLQTSELSEHAYYPPEKIDTSIIPPHLAELLKVALQARTEKKTSYIEIKN